MLVTFNCSTDILYIVIYLQIVKMLVTFNCSTDILYIVIYLQIVKMLVTIVALIYYILLYIYR